MACGPARCLASSCLVVSLPRVARRVRRRPAAYRPQGLSIPGRRQFPGGVIYSAPFSLAHLARPVSSPHRFIVSFVPSHPSHGSPSHPGKQAGRARRRAVIGGSHPRHRIPAPSRLRPVSPLVSACGAKNVSFPSVLCRHRTRASPHRSPWLKRFNHSSARARSHPGQTSRQRRPVHRSVPRVGGRKVIDPAPVSVLVAPSSARLASKQNGGGPRPVRPPRPHPIRLIGSSAHRIIRLVPHVG